MGIFLACLGVFILYLFVGIIFVKLWEMIDPYPKFNDYESWDNFSRGWFTIFWPVCIVCIVFYWTIWKPVLLAHYIVYEVCDSISSIKKSQTAHGKYGHPPLRKRS